MGNRAIVKPEGKDIGVYLHYCPCLRNNLYGEFYCFFDSGITIPYFDLDVIPDHCPLIEKDN